MFQFSLSSLPSASNAAETRLVEQARAGDRAAFTALFERYNAPLCRYLAHLVSNDELGRDLAQEAFFAAWRALPEMGEALHFRAWLYRIATNQAYSHLRRARLVRWLPFADHEDQSGARPPVVAGPEAQIGEAEQLALALAQVTPKYRACLLLQVQEGLSQREIAHLLHLPEKQIGVYVSRAREQFRRAYHCLNSDQAPQEKGRARR
jgi:RNA polymerase sigma-70 factor (ECF subfamily)